MQNAKLKTNLGKILDLAIFIALVGYCGGYASNLVWLDITDPITGTNSSYPIGVETSKTTGDQSTTRGELLAYLGFKESEYSFSGGTTIPSGNEPVKFTKGIGESPKSERWVIPNGERSDQSEYLGEWRITRYYTPLKGQPKYFNGTYEKDFYINCSGNCFITADGTDLHNVQPYTVAACPPSFKFGEALWVEGVGKVVCHDRGGAIKGKRLDIWAGAGSEGLQNIYDRPETSGIHKIYKLT